MTAKPLLSFNASRAVEIIRYTEQFTDLATGETVERVFDAAIKAQVARANADAARRRDYMRTYMAKRRAEGKA